MPCKATKRKMAQLGIAYYEVDLTDVPDKVEEFIELGHAQAPVVITSDDMWSGYRPDKINQLTSE